MSNISIAIDGPAGSGKSTISKLLAKNLDYIYIDTGAMYRAITLYFLEKNIGYNDNDTIISHLESIEIKFKDNGKRVTLNGKEVTEDIRSTKVTKSVSMYSKIKEVRDFLVNQQRDLAKCNNVVMDGRDIGSNVLKDAEFKFFLNASIEVRANRRYEELKNSKNISYDKVKCDIINRDEQDMNREISPLIKVKDAIEIDTSSLSIEEVIEAIQSKIKARD